MTLNTWFVKFLLSVSLLSGSLTAYSSTPPRQFDACAGPPVPRTLSSALANQQYHENDTNYQVFDDNLSAAQGQKIYEGRLQQARHYRLLAGLLSGSSNDLIESFSNPQPGDLEHFRPMLRYYFASLHGEPVDALKVSALEAGFEWFEKVENRGKPTNYTWYDAIARSVLLLHGNLVDPVKLYGQYFNAESYRTESTWLELLASLRRTEDSLAAKHYEQTSDQLLAARNSIDSLLGSRSGCAESPSVAVGEILQSYVLLSTKLMVATRGAGALPVEFGRTVHTLSATRVIMAKAIDPVGYPALSARILRAGAAFDRFRAEVRTMNPMADGYRNAATRAESLATYLDGR